MNFKLFLSIIFICFNQLLSRSPDGLQLERWLPEREYYYLARLRADDGSFWFLKADKNVCHNLQAEYDYLIFDRIGYIAATFLGLNAPEIHFVRFNQVNASVPFAGDFFVGVYQWIDAESVNFGDSLQQRVHRFPGRLSHDERGLGRALLKAAAEHDDFPLIAALDTFFCNVDRTDENIMVNAQDSKLYLIDFENALHRPLAKYALGTIQQLILNKEVISPQEVVVLIKYIVALGKLTTYFTPKKFSQLFRSVAREVDLVDQNGKFENSDAWRRFLLYRRVFVANYYYCKMLFAAVSEYFDFWIHSSEDLCLTGITHEYIHNVCLELKASCIDT